MPTLADLIDARILQARQRRIFEKAKEVIQRSGQFGWIEKDKVQMFLFYDFDSEEVTIHIHTGQRQNVFRGIHFRGEKEPRILGYAPGDWENTLDRLYDPISRQLEFEQRVAMEAADEDTRKTWGLSS